MEIKLRDIYADIRKGGETTAFQATLYINGHKVGVAANNGDGGATMYHTFDYRGNMLLKEAEAWCRTLPPTVLPDVIVNGKPMTVPTELDIYIEKKIVEWFNEKQAQKFRRRMEKEMIDVIVFGEPGKTFRVMKYRRPIASIIQFNKGVERLREDISTQVIPLLEKNEVILNTNIPPQIVRLLKVPRELWVEQGN